MQQINKYKYNNIEELFNHRNKVTREIHKLRIYFSEWEFNFRTEFKKSNEDIYMSYHDSNEFFDKSNEVDFKIDELLNALIKIDDILIPKLIKNDSYKFIVTQSHLDTEV